MAALATMLRRALPLGSHVFRSQRILHIAAISTATILHGRQQTLTPHFSRFSRIQQLSTAIIDGEPSADENLIRVVAPEIEDKPGVFKLYLHRTYGDKVVRIKVDMENAVIDEDNTIESLPFVATVTKPNGQVLMLFIQVFPGKFEIKFADIRDSEPPANVRKESFPLRVREFGPSIYESFCKYLEGRGMDASTSMSFLFNYIDYRNKRDHMILYEDIVKNSVLNSIVKPSHWRAARRSARKTKLLASLARKKLARD